MNENVDLVKLPKEVLGTSLIPNIDNGPGHRIVVKTRGSGNCLYNSTSLSLCGDESRSTALCHLVASKFISMPSNTRLLGSLLSSRRFPNLCDFQLLWVDGVEHRVSTPLRNQDHLNLVATEIMRIAFFISSQPETAIYIMTTKLDF